MKIVLLIEKNLFTDMSENLLIQLNQLIIRWISKYELILLAPDDETKVLSKLKRFLGNKYSKVITLYKHDDYTFKHFKKYLPYLYNANYLFEINQNFILSKTHIKTEQSQANTIKPKLAYFSPLPPDKSGIAIYSKELLPYLQDYYDITLVVKTISTDYKKENDYKMIDLKEFQKNANLYDRYLYHLGNSHFHTYMWDLLDKYKGTIVLHDFYIGDLLAYDELWLQANQIWTQELFISHGFKAIINRFKDDKHINLTKINFPCNYKALQASLGIITHSQHSINLAREWYHINDINKWKQIPLLKEKPNKSDKLTIKKKLGFKKDDIIICSFGILNYTKLNHKLLDAFLHSKLAQQDNIYLIFAGQNSDPQYSEELLSTINKSGIKNRIKITGWCDDNTFQEYLQITDIGVQLRTQSRGESSGTVLDCMNYSIATIINTNGSMDEIPKDCVYAINDNFDDIELIQALETLIDNQQLRLQLAKKASTYIQTYHLPKYCANLYHQSIEEFHIYDTIYNDMIQAIKTESNLNNLNDIAHSIQTSLPTKLIQRTIYIDISAIYREDLKTGIQRVVKAQLKNLLELTQTLYRIEAVYLDVENNQWVYRYARDYLSDFFDLPITAPQDIVEFCSHDILYIADLYPSGHIQAYKDNLYQSIQARGTTIITQIYDLLPITHPQFFPPNSGDIFKKWLDTVIDISDGFITISDDVNNELNKYIGDKTFTPIKTLHLGSDIQNSISKANNNSNDFDNFLQEIKQTPYFLMVSTIEPRKGYMDIIKVFEQLWTKGYNEKLILVGKEGWQGLNDDLRRDIPQTISYIQSHPQLNKNLFWLNGVDDMFLTNLYQNAKALIVASYAEGFGLPIIEAAQYNKPLILRNISVFKEIAQDEAYYFTDTKDLSIIVDEFIKWIELDNQKLTKYPNIQIKSWQDNAKELFEILHKLANSE